MNDFQNAYETAKMQKWHRVTKTMEEAQAQHEAGKYVVIFESLSYCPYTDAAMGTMPHIMEAFDTQEEAQAYINKNYEEFGACEAVDMFIYPRPVIERKARYIPEDFDDIPF